MRRHIIAMLVVPAFATLWSCSVTMRDSPPMREIGVDRMFTERALIVKGQGFAPADGGLATGQRMLMAKRAAKIVALRRMAEALNGVRLSGETTVKDAAVASDRIRTTVDAFIKGAQVVSEAYDDGQGVATVYVKIGLDGPDGLLSDLMPAVSQVEGVAVESRKYRPTSTAPPATEPADALIIDARGKSLRPALANRVLAGDGSVLFEPRKLPPEVLAAKGCGDYTDSVGKARAILAKHGAHNPLVVRVDSVVRSTDAKVSDADAALIFTANQKTHFLEGARVVFVL